MSRLHNWLCQVLDEMGIDYNTEEPVGPYFIDCYAPKYKAGFEADGPYHVQSRDMKRDQYILDVSGIRILRLTHQDLSNRTKRAFTKLKIQEFIRGS